MNAHVLIVEDEPMVQELLALHLRNEGHAVSLASSGREMFAILDKDVVDLILLDLTLPDEDGMVLARRVRSRSTVPIIVLTARDIMDARLNALRIGVDDYMVKPYDPQELVLKIQNLLVRARSNETSPSNGGGALRFGSWTLDIGGRALTGAEGRETHLSPGEFNLLAALARAPDRVLSRAQLLDAISRNDGDPSDRAVDIVISRLRGKIETDPKKPRIILTITGYGYKLAGKIRANDE